MLTVAVSRAAVAVGDRVGEAVRAVEVGGRRVGERAVAVVHHGAVGRLGEAVDRERVEVDVGVVGQQRGGGDHQRCVFGGRTASSVAIGASLTGSDRDVDGGRVGAAVAVGDRVGEAVRAVEVGVGV